MLAHKKDGNKKDFHEVVDERGFWRGEELSGKKCKMGVSFKSYPIMASCCNAIKN